MDTRLTTHDTWRLLIATIVALALVMALGATSVSAVSPTACRVQNTDTGRTYTALQAAVDAASEGDRLTVKGTCIGTTIIGKKLLIEGVRSPTSGKPTLSGAGKTRVVLIDRGVRVSMASLLVTRGALVRRVHGTEVLMKGSGVLNRGHLTLRDVGVLNIGPLVVCRDLPHLRQRLRCAESGWGALLNTGTLSLNGASRVVGNRAGVVNRGTMRLNGASTISSRRTVRNDGVLVLNGTSRIGRRGTAFLGGGVVNNGTLTLNGASQISGNHRGLYTRGTATLNDTSAIRDNHVPDADCGPTGSAALMCVGLDEGGGVFLDGGSLTLNDGSTISGNSAAGWGGGVFAVLGSRLTLNDASTISGNTASQGGGLYHGSGTFVGVICGPGGNVHGNTPDDCWPSP